MNLCLFMQISLIQKNISQLNWRKSMPNFFCRWHSALLQIWKLCIVVFQVPIFFACFTLPHKCFFSISKKKKFQKLLFGILTCLANLAYHALRENFNAWYKRQNYSAQNSIQH